MYGRRIRELRESMGLNQGEFANMLHIPQSTVSSYEHERTEPSIATIKLICSTCDVDVAWLLGMTNYRELATSTYNMYADLVSMGFSTDEAHRITKSKFNEYGDMIMQLSFENRKKVEDYCRELLKEQDE